MSRFLRCLLQRSVLASALVGLVLCSSPARAQVAPPAPASSGGEEEARERAEAAYETSFILFEDEYTAHIHMMRLGRSGHATVTLRRDPVPIRGIQRERLGPVAFYAAVGRADLADEYRRSRRKKRVVGGVSLGALVTSGVLLGVGVTNLVSASSIDLSCDPFSPTYDACSAEEDRQRDRATARAGKWFIGGGGGFVGFLAFAAIYNAMDPHPASEAERRLLAHDHNARLRRELRLPRRRADISLAPFVSGEGGGVMAVGRF